MTVTNGKVEQSDSGKETSYSHNTVYQNVIRYKENENAFIKNFKGGIFSLEFVIKLEGLYD